MKYIEDHHFYCREDEVTDLSTQARKIIKAVDGININNLTPITEGNFGYSLLRLSENNDFVDTLFKNLNNISIPIECIHCESGPGVLEAALEYCDALEMADRAVIFKYVVKSIAKHYGYIATFMESFIGAVLQNKVVWITNELVNSIQTSLAAIISIFLCLIFI